MWSETWYLFVLFNIKPRIKAVCPENDELFEQLTYFINKYSQVGKIIVMGDFNSRTARLPDYIEL